MQPVKSLVQDHGSRKDSDSFAAISERSNVRLQIDQENNNEVDPVLKNDVSLITTAHSEMIHEPKRQDYLKRALKPWQVQMIAIGGTIGTGLFLGTGKSLATGGPGSVLIAYSLCGAIVYLTMLCLGEMATYIPVAGSFTTYTSRFVDEGLGFALTWNYWFNDAVSVAGDLTALQLLIKWWNVDITWPFSLGLLILVIVANVFGVKVYGIFEYVLSVIKVITIILFIIVGIVVNCGGNTSRHYIGFEYWRIRGAPFVGGIGGFASVFVTAAFAFGGTESIGVTAGETRNPRRNMPGVIRNVFWRVLVFYVLGTFIVGLDIPYNADGLSEHDTNTSPFTLVFKLAGFNVAAHMINAVIITSVMSAANHALFAGTRLMYALAAEQNAPAIFKKITKNQTPLFALLATSAVSTICFASSFVGAGKLWNWLQSIVGVSNQIAWVCIGLAAWRFRNAYEVQGKDVSELPFVNPFRKWSPQVVVFANIFLIIVQGWESVVPSKSEDGKFSFVTFLSYYIEIPILLLMWLIYKIVRKTTIIPLETMNLETDRYVDSTQDLEEIEDDKKSSAFAKGWWTWLV